MKRISSKVGILVIPVFISSCGFLKYEPPKEYVFRVKEYEICRGRPLNLCSDAYAHRWYADSARINYLGDESEMSTPPIYNDTAFYVYEAAVNLEFPDYGSLKNFVFTKMVVKVKDSPKMPYAIFRGDSLIVKEPDTSLRYEWFTLSSRKGDCVGLSCSYKKLLKHPTYYLKAVGVNGCESPGLPIRRDMIKRVSRLVKTEE